MAQIKEWEIFWGELDIMAEGGPDKRTDSRAAEKCEGFDEDGSGGRRHTYADAL